MKKISFILTIVLFAGLFVGAKAIGLETTYETEEEGAAQLVAAAKDRTKRFVLYDSSYRRIDYPGGDVKDSRGVCSDVVVRSYRKLGIDLQVLIHEDMSDDFEAYPDRWGLTRPDRNIDHRRVPNIRRFLEREGAELDVSEEPADYQPGDIVTWVVGGNRPHIGIVSDVIARSGNPKIIHNIGWGTKMEDMLFDYRITGHYRYFP